MATAVLFVYEKLFLYFTCIHRPPLRLFKRCRIHPDFLIIQLQLMKFYSFSFRSNIKEWNKFVLQFDVISSISDLYLFQIDLQQFYKCSFYFASTSTMHLFDMQYYVYKLMYSLWRKIMRKIITCITKLFNKDAAFYRRKNKFIVVI